MDTIKNKSKYIILIILIISLIVAAIYSMVDTSDKIVYPILYSEEINQYSSEFNLDKAIVYSVVNVESSFRPEVISKSNAIGLMQLKLDTAKDMARYCNDTAPTEDDLKIANINIKYGCRYIRYLLDYYQQDIYLALAAYNGGLSNVNYWIEHYNILNNVDNIPYKETREYIKKVNKNYTVYSKYLKDGKI